MWPSILLHSLCLFCLNSIGYKARLDKDPALILWILLCEPNIKTFSIYRSICIITIFFLVRILIPNIDNISGLENLGVQCEFFDKQLNSIHKLLRSLGSWY